MALWTLITSTVFLRGQFSFTASAQGHDQVLWNQIPRGEEPNSLWFSQLALSDFLILLILVHVDMRMPCAMSVVWWKYTNDSWHSSLYFLTGKRYRDVEDIWRLEAFSTFLSNPFHLQTPPNPNLCRHSLVYSGFAMFFLWRDLNIQAMLPIRRQGKENLATQRSQLNQAMADAAKEAGGNWLIWSSQSGARLCCFSETPLKFSVQNFTCSNFFTIPGRMSFVFIVPCFSVFFLNNLDKWEMFPIEAAILQHMRKRSFYSLVNAFC